MRVFILFRTKPESRTKLFIVGLQKQVVNHRYILLLTLILVIPAASAYDSELLGVSDLLFVVSQLGLEDFDARADYSGDGVVDIFDLVLVASHIGYPRSDARQWVLNPSVPVGEFLGQYYDGTNFQELLLTRVDPVIDFNWQGGSPDPVVPVDYFSVRWVGDFDFAPGTYRFTATTDDGMRVFVDDEVIIDQWRAQAATTYTTEQVLDGRHRVRVEYFENAAQAIARVSWALVDGEPQDPPPGTPPPSDPDPIPLPTVTLTASPTSITQGSSSTLTWSSTDAASCTASGAWSGSRATSGSTSVNPSTTRTYTLTCSNVDGDSTSASQQIVVSTPPPPTMGSIPVPQPEDTIILDTRQSLQQASTHAEAASLFSNVHPNLRSSNPNAWGFTTDFDGTGTRALVAKWVGVGTNWGDQSRMIQQYFPSDVRPQDLYIQHRLWMGRTPYDTDVAHGVMERFRFVNPDDVTSPNAARKMLRTVGPRWTSDIQRTTAIFPGPEPLRFRLYGDYNTPSSRSDGSLNFVTQDLENRELVFTYRIRAESAQGVQDGISAWWLHDGTTGELIDSAMKTDAEFGFYGTSIVTFPTVMRSPVEDMSEYYWDVLLWTTD